MRYTNYAQLPLILTVKEVAEVLGLGRNTVYELVRQGQIRSIRIGRQIKVPKSALVEFLKGT